MNFHRRGKEPRVEVFARRNDTLLLNLFLATNAHRCPWHGNEPFLIDVFTAADTFSVFTVVYLLDGFLNESQTREIAFVQIMIWSRMTKEILSVPRSTIEKR